MLDTYDRVVRVIKMAEVIHGRGYVYSIQYHIVWCVKYRRKILYRDVVSSLRSILDKISQDNGFHINEFSAEPDHVHILLSCSPQHYIPDMIKALKGASGRLLMKEFGDELRNKLWDGHVWNRSYFIATVNDNTEEQVRNYIHAQRER